VILTGELDLWTALPHREFFSTAYGGTKVNLLSQKVDSGADARWSPHRPLRFSMPHVYAANYPEIPGKKGA